MVIAATAAQMAKFAFLIGVSAPAARFAAGLVPLLPLMSLPPATNGSGGAPTSRITGMPQIGLGTYQLAGDACYEAVLEALRLGYRHLDTADVYDNYAAIGNALREASRSLGIRREDVFVTSKIAFNRMAFAHASDAIENALNGLGVSYLDCVLVHFPAPYKESFPRIEVWAENFIGVEGSLHAAFVARVETWRAMEDAQRAGKVRWQ
jgi:diketogulonate reductase-like aldo/keto reductase